MGLFKTISDWFKPSSTPVPVTEPRSEVKPQVRKPIEPAIPKPKPTPQLTIPKSLTENEDVEIVTTKYVAPAPVKASKPVQTTVAKPKKTPARSVTPNTLGASNTDTPDFITPIIIASALSDSSSSSSGYSDSSSSSYSDYSSSSSSYDSGSSSSGSDF